MEFSKDTTAFPAQRLRECAALCSVSVDVLHPLSNGPRIFCVALMSSKFMNKRRSEWNETRFFWIPISIIATTTNAIDIHSSGFDERFDEYGL